MHQLTVSMIKGLNRGTRSLLPREGTNVRFLYDLLYEYRGRPVPTEELMAAGELISSPRKARSAVLHSIRRNLVDFWGCDIRTSGSWTMTLVGEFVGKIYIDYTRPAEEQADLPAHLLDLVPDKRCPERVDTLGD